MRISSHEVVEKLTSERGGPIASFDFDGALKIQQFNKLNQTWVPSDNPNEFILSEAFRLSYEGWRIVIITNRDKNEKNKKEINDFILNYGLPVSGTIFTAGQGKATFLSAVKATIHYDDNQNELLQLAPFDIMGVLVPKQEQKNKIEKTTLQDKVEYRLNGKLHREDGPAIELSDGSKFWYYNGKLHRENGPAIEHASGRKYWYINGLPLTDEDVQQLKKNKVERIEYEDRVEYRLNGEWHREDGPAIEYKNGTKHWYINGKRHREDGPAVIREDGSKEWYINNLRHREDGPAVENKDGTKFWFFNGHRHREDGPAVEYTDGYKEWFINGKRHREDGPAIDCKDGRKLWYVKGKLHRKDGPAVEYANGNKEWWFNNKKLTEEEFNKKYKIEKIELESRVEYRLNGVLHREDGPAIEDKDGTKEWYIKGNILTEKEFNKLNKNKIEKVEFEDRVEYKLNGVLHREDGPAIEQADGNKGWYINGKELTEEEFNELKKNKVERTEYEDRVEYRLNGRLHREDGPAIEWKNGIKEWVFNGKLHREDGPAVEFSTGNRHWYINGKLHRLDGPAVELTNGEKHWYINGEQLTEEEFNKLRII